MIQFKPIVVALFVIAPVSAFAQTKGAIKAAILSRYSVTQPTDDHRAVVTAGAVIDVLKDDLAVVTTAQLLVDSGGNPIYPTEPTSTYKNGKLQMSRAGKFWSGGHSLVAGEKCWLIGVEVRDDAAVLEFLTDPINGVPFRGFVKYPFPKGEIPAPEAVLQQIGETIKPEPTQAAPMPPLSHAAVAPPAPIPPPPPAPPDPPKPKTIAIGQTKAQVIAALGEPLKVATLPTKEIDFFADVKVTFVKGRVVNVQ